MASEELLSEWAKRLEEQKAQAAAANEAMNAQQSGDTTAQIGLGILPMLAGAAFGKKGLHAGAQAGMLGLQDYQKRVADENVLERKLAQAKAKIFESNAANIQKNIDALQGKVALQEDFPDKGTSVSIENKSESVGAQEAAKKLLEAKEAKDTVEVSSRAILDKLEEVKKVEGEQGEENFLKSTFKNMGASIDPNSKRGELRSLLIKTLIEGNKKALGGQVSNYDQQLREKAEGMGMNFNLDMIRTLAERNLFLSNERFSNAVKNAQDWNSFVPESYLSQVNRQSQAPTDLTLSVDPSAGIPDELAADITESLKGQVPGGIITKVNGKIAVKLPDGSLRVLQKREGE